MSFLTDAGLILGLAVGSYAFWLRHQRSVKRRADQAPGGERHDAIVAYLRSHFDR
jgi:hypothetical protein